MSTDKSSTPPINESSIDTNTSSDDTDLVNKVKSEITQLQEIHQQNIANKKKKNKQQKTPSKSISNVEPDTPERIDVTTDVSKSTSVSLPSSSPSNTLSISPSLPPSLPQTPAQALLALQAPYTRLVSLGQAAAQSTSSSSELVSRLISLHDLNIARQSHINALHSQLHGHHLIHTQANTMKINTLNSRMVGVQQELSQGRQALQCLGQLIDRQEKDIQDMAERVDHTEHELQTQDERINGLGSELGLHKDEYKSQMNEYDVKLQEYHKKIDKQTILMKKQQSLLESMTEKRVRQDLLVDIAIVIGAIYATSNEWIQQGNYMLASNVVSIIGMLMRHEGANKWDSYTVYRRSRLVQSLIRMAQVCFIVKKARALAQKYGLHQRKGTYGTYIGWIGQIITGPVGADVNIVDADVNVEETTKTDVSINNNNNNNNNNNTSTTTTTTTTPVSSSNNNSDRERPSNDRERSTLSLFIGNSISAIHALYGGISSFINPTVSDLANNETVSKKTVSNKTVSSDKTVSGDNSNTVIVTKVDKIMSSSDSTNGTYATKKNNNNNNNLTNVTNSSSSLPHTNNKIIHNKNQDEKDDRVVVSGNKALLRAQANNKNPNPNPIPNPTLVPSQEVISGSGSGDVGDMDVDVVLQDLNQSVAALFGSPQKPTNK